MINWAFLVRSWNKQEKISVFWGWRENEINRETTRERKEKANGRMGRGKKRKIQIQIRK